jgi:hypothetical protein
MERRAFWKEALSLPHFTARQGNILFPILPKTITVLQTGWGKPREII